LYGLLGTVSDIANLKIIWACEKYFMLQPYNPQGKGQHQTRNKGRGGKSLRRIKQVVFALPSVD
jgi:hypothetical protein